MSAFLRALLLLTLFVGTAQTQEAPAENPPSYLEVKRAEPNADGVAPNRLYWDRGHERGVLPSIGWAVLRAKWERGPWVVLRDDLPRLAQGFSDQLSDDDAPPDGDAWYRVVQLVHPLPAAQRRKLLQQVQDGDADEDTWFQWVTLIEGLGYASPAVRTGESFGVHPRERRDIQRAQPRGQVVAVTELKVQAPPNNDGLNLELSWTASSSEPRIAGYAVVRADSEDGPWELLSANLTAQSSSYSDKVSTNPAQDPPRDRYWYRVITLAGEPVGDDPEQLLAAVEAAGSSTAAVSGVPKAAWLKTSLGPMMLLLIIAAVGGLMLWFTKRAQAGEEIFIRRIPGIDAIEEGIGRATEMGQPVLYVPGIDELQDIQTIASMLILGQVSKMVAEYQSEIIVSCCIPIVREVADEVVKAGFYQAGHPDAYQPRNTRFISSEQFAFCAGTNGIIHREKPATNIYLGRFFAESLILAETGFINKSIQIAGTAEATQLPFFIAACDYTLIGEELFAVSAYLSRDPRLVSSLKASDWIKVFCVTCILLGTLLASFGNDFFIHLFTIAG